MGVSYTFEEGEASLVILSNCNSYGYLDCDYSVVYHDLVADIADFFAVALPRECERRALHSWMLRTGGG